jgi:DNA-binding MarR family transcriptional regulator
VYLHHTEKAAIPDLRHNIKASQSATYNALTLSKKNGLIEEERAPGFSRRIDVSLTEKGTKVAEVLIQLKKALTNQQEASKAKGKPEKQSYSHTLPHYLRVAQTQYPIVKASMHNYCWAI